MKLPAFITPNFITVMRLVFVPVGAYTLFKNGGDDTTWRVHLVVCFSALGMSDVLDGKLARSRGTITEFGKFLDPV
jgi:CDP-diacylglycerol--glycerol-3-phosphate 3-phosphatidyltransferase